MPSVTGTQKIVDVPAYSAGNPATVVQVLPPGKKDSYRIMNLGPGVVHYGFDNSVTPGRGWPLDPPATTGGMGGGDVPVASYDGAIWAVSTAGAAIVVQVFRP